MENEKEIGRKEFLLGGLGYLRDTFAGLLSIALPDPVERPIRPPGALPEGDFLRACTRCDECIKACPEEAITKILDPAQADYLTPVIHPRATPCKLCEGLPCISSCQSRALAMPARVEEVRMGTARVQQERCYAWQGQECDYCRKSCPLETPAIGRDDLGRPFVNIGQCTGCGLCEYICPSRETAIKVRRME